MPNILERRLSYKPFEYPLAYEFWETDKYNHWLWTEVNNTIENDKHNWHYDLTEEEKSVVGGILKGFAQTECLVNNYWTMAALWFPKPEISMLCTSLAEDETRHTKAYNYLNEILDLEEYDAFLEEREVAERLSNLVTVRDSNPFEIARSLAIFSAFCEGVSLFSAFAVLLSFSRRSLLNSIGKIIEWSAIDECYSADTEVLTTDGWVRFDKLTPSYQLAQLDTKTKEIHFGTPSRIVIKGYTDKMVKFDHPLFKANVTVNHDMVYRTSPEGEYIKGKAKDLLSKKGVYFLPTVSNDDLTVIVDVQLDDVDTKVYDYTGMVYCATVEKGTLVTRYNNTPAIAGNCLHSTAGIWLFRTLISEHPSLNTEELKAEVFEAARLAVKLEEQYIDYVFQKGDVKGLTKHEMKQFVRFRSNNKLKELGYEPIFELDETAALLVNEWFEQKTKATIESDFFATTEASYTKRTLEFSDDIEW